MATESRARHRTSGFSVRRLPGAAAIALLCFGLLYSPIVTLVVYSFNAGSSIAVWEGLSWRWYVAAWQNREVQEAALRSLVIASCAATLRSRF
jgi:spermidine/putrescine transport system permease protein